MNRSPPDPRVLSTSGSNSRPEVARFYKTTLMSICNILDNVVICQFDKIQRVRNKWRFNLKDGIMNLNGKDYVFQRASGESDW